MIRAFWRETVCAEVKGIQRDTKGIQKQKTKNKEKQPTNQPKKPKQNKISLSSNEGELHTLKYF